MRFETSEKWRSVASSIQRRIATAPSGSMALIGGTLLAGAGLVALSESRLRASRQLQEKDRIMDAFFSATPAGLAILTRDLRYERINQMLARINNAPLRAHLNKTVEEVLGSTATLIMPLLKHVLSTGEPVLNAELSGEAPGRPGTRRHWVASYFPIPDGRGSVERIGAVVIDITRRKEAEQALRASEQMLRSLSSSLLTLQDQERRRIARELHDSIGQCLAAIRMNLEVLKKNIDGDKLCPKAAKALAEATHLAEQCSTDTRTISYLLHPPLLDDAGLASAIRWYADGFAERSGIKVEVDVPSSFERLPPEIETMLFRIVQESLTNIHRHSGSPTARIQLTSDAESVVLEVQDTGRGLSAASLHRMNCAGKPLGVGIAGMRERVRQFGGTLDLLSEQGTTVRAVIPIGGDSCRNSESWLQTTTK